MCFESTKYARYKIAKTDIICWKFVLEDYKSPFRNFLYEKGIIQPVVPLFKNQFFEINKGYHSYRTKELADIYCCGRRICQFAIPKGIKYYSNREGDYVSETIILLK